MEKYKSKFEQKFANTLQRLNQPVRYEQERVTYTLTNHYTPDWKIADNVYIETKGLWDSADRRKILAVIKQNPHITVIMCFQNPNQPINKGSKTTYSKFCDKNKIMWTTLDRVDEVFANYSQNHQKE